MIGGRREGPDIEQTCPDHRAESAGAVRPARLVGVRLSDSGRLRGVGGLPQGARRPVLRRPRRSRALQIPAVHVERIESVFHRRVPVLVPRHLVAEPEGGTARPVCSGAIVQSAGHLLADRNPFSLALRVTFRLRSPRPLSRDVRVPVPVWCEEPPRAPCCSWSDRPSATPITSSRPTTRIATWTSTETGSTPSG